MMNYTETIKYLFSALPSFQNVGSDAYKPGLERIATFCKGIGEPHKCYPVIHVAGTNGKGSTSHILASVLQSAGYKVGLFTSPHLRDFRERIRICGAMISEAEVVRFVGDNREAMERLQLSFFEMSASMAFAHFAHSQVDVAVIETGLGGRLDATNIVDPFISVITNIGLDHTQYLGDTIEKIADEKAGIIKRGRPVVVGQRSDSYDDVFTSRAAEMGSELIFAEDRFRVVDSGQDGLYQRVVVERLSDQEVTTYELDLLGEYQRRNILTALTALERLNILNISGEAIKRGVRNVCESTSFKGRWQIIEKEPLTICDTGHNDHGLTEVTRQLSQLTCRRLFCVLGFTNEKNIREILPHFPSKAHFIFTRAKIDRALATDEIARVAGELSLDFEVVEGVEQSYKRARELATADDVIFIGGSTFVVAEIDL
ncbi:MAG: folylpolyglutamate synthase/dihydrofolate synthase family protein [Rikenellaceae bacterium]